MSKSDTAINVRVLIEQWKVCSEYLRAYNSQAMNRAADRGDALAAALEARLYCTLCGRETPHDEVVDMETTTRTDIPPSQPATCGLCGVPMPPGEEMFQYHGASGSCPKPVVPARRNAATGGEAELLAEWEEARLIGFRQDRASRMRRAGDAIAAGLRKCIKALEVSERNLQPAPPLPIIDCECGACQRLRQKQIERVAPPPAATGDEELIKRATELSNYGRYQNTTHELLNALAAALRQRGEEMEALRADHLQLKALEMNHEGAVVRVIGERDAALARVAELEQAMNEVNKPAPLPSLTADEALLERVLNVCRNECSIEGALTLDTLATRFRQRGEELAEWKNDAAEWELEAIGLQADVENISALLEKTRAELAAAIERGQQ